MAGDRGGERTILPLATPVFKGLEPRHAMNRNGSPAKGLGSALVSQSRVLKAERPGLVRMTAGPFLITRARTAS